MLMKVFNDSSPYVGKIKQSNCYIHNSAVMFWRVTGESQLINSFKMAIWKVYHSGRLMANFFSLQVEMLKLPKKLF